MSAPNFNCSHNSRHLYAFCCFNNDFDAYKKDLKETIQIITKKTRTI